MRIAICEDLREDAMRLEGNVERFLKENHLSADIELFESGEDFLAAFSPGKYHIIFMDIFMKKGGITGMRAAEIAYSADPEAAIIFTTISTAHLYRGYSFAVFYIVKPVEYGKLAEGLNKCRTQIERHAKTMEIMVDRQLTQIRLRSIYCVESRGRACVFTFADGALRANMTISAVEEKLGGDPFVRCHNSFIVNMVHVDDMMEVDFLMRNGDAVPISKAFHALARKAFNEHIRRRVQGRTV